MTSLSLRLICLSNLRFQAEADDYNAHYIFEQSVKYWRCGGDAAFVPLRLLNRHLETAEERNEQAITRGLQEPAMKKKIVNLKLLFDLFMKEIEHELKRAPSRTDAACLSRIFCLGKEGVRIWERARFRRKPVAPVNKKPKYRSNARNAAAKRKQAPTATTPDNLLPPPSPKHSNEDDQEVTSPATTIEAGHDESSENDPPAFTRDPSITRFKTRFAIQSSSPLPAAAPLNVFDDTLCEANSAERSGTTPPGEDNFAAAAPMVIPKGDGEESNTADSTVPVKATEEKQEGVKEKQGRGIAEDIEQMTACLII